MEEIGQTQNSYPESFRNIAKKKKKTPYTLSTYMNSIENISQCSEIEYKIRNSKSAKPNGLSGIYSDLDSHNEFTSSKKLGQIPELINKISTKNLNKFDFDSLIKKKQIDKIQGLKQTLDIGIEDLASDMIDLYFKEKELARFLTFIKECNLNIFDNLRYNEILDNVLIKNVKKAELKDISIAAIDGSNVNSLSYGLDLALIRAVCVLYNFDSDGKAEILEFPSEWGEDNFKMLKFLKPDHESNILFEISLERALLEVKLAIDVINRLFENSYNPKISNPLDVLILDGSIIPEPLNMMPKNGNRNNIKFKSQYNRYLELVKNYNILYNLCEKYGILLVGSIKDTRSSTLVKFLKRNTPIILRKFSHYTKSNPRANNHEITRINTRLLYDYFTDLLLFNRILKEKQRSCAFNISNQSESFLSRQLDEINEILSEDQFEKLSSYNFYAFYLKPVEFDLPIRIEFYMPTNLTSGLVHDNDEKQQRYKDESEFNEHSTRNKNKNKNKDKNDKKSRIEEIERRLEKIASIIQSLSDKFGDKAIIIPQLEAHYRCKISEQTLMQTINLLKSQISEKFYEILSKQGERDVLTAKTNIYEDRMFLEDLMMKKKRNSLPFS